MELTMNLTTIIPIIGALVALTNIIVQVFKRILPDNLPTNIFTVIVAVALTVFVGVAYCQVKLIAMHWYLWPTLVVAGFLVAYAAMFGFDKLKEAMNWGGKDE